MKIIILLSFVLLSSILINAQNYLPRNAHAYYRYVKSYTKDWKDLGRIAGPAPIISINVLANNFDGRPRGSLSFVLSKENYEVISSSTLNYFGGVDNGWYHFAAASEMFNPITGTWMINYYVVPMHILLYKDYRTLRFSLGNQWDEYVLK